MCFLDIELLYYYLHHAKLVGHFCEVFESLILSEIMHLYVSFWSAFVACGQHCSDDDSTTRPLLLVTASVDKMVLKKPLRVDTDLKIAGAVTWAGRSSIEIQIEVTQTHQQGIWNDSIW